MRVRLTVMTVTLVVLAVACGIPDEGPVSKIQDKDLRGLDDTIPSTTTTTTPETTLEPTTSTTLVNAPTTVPTEEVTLFFVSGGQLAPSPAALNRGAIPNQLLFALQAGPLTGEPGGGLRSALPDDIEAITATTDSSGIAAVTLPTDFFDRTAQEDQLLAIGQIVLTITENIRGVGQVLFFKDQQPVGVPRPSGLSNGTDPLARRDYEELLDRPVATTTTTTPPIETPVT